MYFLNKLIASHPSKTLRRLMVELVPILQKHPRSKVYDTELDFFTAHRRWKETLVRNYRRHVDDLEDDDGTGNGEEGEWRSGVETICAILEGDRDALFALCSEQEWGWREALGVWGVWYDIKFTREALPYV
jgi:nuclear pore complex protein Nup85